MKKLLLLSFLSLGAASLLSAGEKADQADKAACSTEKSCCCCEGKDGKCADQAAAKGACAKPKRETTKTAKQ